MATTPVYDLTGFSPDIIRAVEEEAVRDAEHVAIFLDALGLNASPDRPRCFPPDFLLHLGAGLRVLFWEEKGITAHLQAGLGSARQMLADAFRSLTHPVTPSGEDRARQVMILSLEKFAWHARREFGGEVLLDSPDEDAELAALAEFLWANRHAARRSQTETL